MILHIRSIIWLAVPLIIGQLSRTAMSVIDTVIVGNIGADHLAAITIGSSVWFPIFIFGFGIMQSIIPKIAQAHAQGQKDDIALLTWQAVILAFILSVLIAAVVVAIQPLIPLLGATPQVENLSSQYLLALAAGAPGILLFFTFRNIAQAMNDTRSGMVIGLTGLVLNVPLSYLLANGKAGLPALGVAGCGIAFSFINWLSALSYFIYLNSSRRYRAARLFTRPNRIQLRPILALFKIGIPISLTLFCEMMLLDATGLLIASLDTATVAAHGILLNITTLIFTVPYAIGRIVMVKVAHYAGIKAPETSKAITQAGIVSWCFITSVFFATLLLFGYQIAWLYTTDPSVLQVIGQVLVFSAVLQCVDGLQTIIGSASRGYEDNHAVFFITAVCYWGIGLPTAFMLGHHLWRGQPYQLSGYWIGIIAGFTCCAILLWYRFTVITQRLQSTATAVQVRCDPTHH
ncbi:MATE family efflux transporter [Dickeya chrysanthemi]|uniref:MATE family efflux transporter n=1 Tax=Dickeya chrysanthemi TaxID=556 RepID=UPI001CF4EA9B|nr:MATE family efflux transporter [Dickeya chrysanthemi]MCA7006915.1 MATE family efflux transporter [Dickeya chrysanthemi]